MTAPAPVTSQTPVAGAARPAPTASGPAALVQPAPTVSGPAALEVARAWGHIDAAPAAEVELDRVLAMLWRLTHRRE